MRLAVCFVLTVLATSSVRISPGSIQITRGQSRVFVI